MAEQFNELGLRIDTNPRLFEQSGAKCYFCWLGWSKYGADAHLHPQNFGWVECDDPQHPNGGCSGG